MVGEGHAMTTVQRRIERITILKNQTVMKEVKNEENISREVRKVSLFLAPVKVRYLFFVKIHRYLGFKRPDTFKGDAPCLKLSAKVWSFFSPSLSQ